MQQGMVHSVENIIFTGLIVLECAVDIGSGYKKFKRFQEKTIEEKTIIKNNFFLLTAESMSGIAFKKERTMTTISSMSES